MAVVREVYDSDNSEDIFRMELERALEVGNMLQVQCTFGIELSKDWKSSRVVLQFPPGGLPHHHNRAQRAGDGDAAVDRRRGVHQDDFGRRGMRHVHHR